MQEEVAGGWTGQKQDFLPRDHCLIRPNCDQCLKCFSRGFIFKVKPAVASLLSLTWLWNGNVFFSCLGQAKCDTACKEGGPLESLLVWVAKYRDNCSHGGPTGQLHALNVLRVVIIALCRSIAHYKNNLLNLMYDSKN